MSEVEIRKQLERAVSELSSAALRVHSSAVELSRLNKPFAEHKFLNVLGKEINQIEGELRVFLQTLNLEELALITRFPSSQILKNIRGEETKK